MKFGKRAAAAALTLTMAAAVPPYAGAAGTVQALLSNESVYLDGQPRSISAYQIDGSNYFMLRDLAALLGGSAAQFSLETDISTYTIRLTTGQPYAAGGDELTLLEGGTAEAVPSKWGLTVNGTQVPVSAYTINGFNFFKLRDVGDAAGFAVTYNPADKHVYIQSAAPADQPTGDQPTGDQPTSDQPASDQPTGDQPAGEQPANEPAAAFSAEIPACEAVDPSWFDDAAFVGDSVSAWLSFYSGDKGLGGATFLTATSLGIENALKPVSEKSVHPSYRGTKMKVEDALVKCGAKKVYLMLGMNDVTYGVERVTTDYKQLLGNIQAAVPGIQIYIESVMPMLNTSKRANSKLNNENIRAFNNTMKAACQENGWYYLDIASVYADEYGGLRADACSDADDMGLHITSAATADWVNYLRTHVPQ